MSDKEHTHHKGHPERLKNHPGTSSECPDNKIFMTGKYFVQEGQIDFSKETGGGQCKALTGGEATVGSVEATYKAILHILAHVDLV